MWFDRHKLRKISSRLRDTSRTGLLPGEETVSGANDRNHPRADQRLLWVDGVGGYLLCLADELLIGQPGAPDSALPPPDLPLLADISRRHLRIRRESGGYLLQPHGDTWVNSQQIDSPTLITGGEEIRLGESVRLRFSKPHALSATAKLVVESGHRTDPAVDAVLMMAESCVLGPAPHSHIHCPRWSGEAILFRASGGLQCRSDQELTVDSAPIRGAVTIEPGRRIEGQDFAMTVEEVDGR